MRELSEMRSEVRSEIKSLRQEIRAVSPQKQDESPAAAFRSFVKISSVEEMERNETVFCSPAEEDVTYQMKLVRFLISFIDN